MSGQGQQIAWDSSEGDHFESDAYYHGQWQAFALRRSLALFSLYAWPLVALGLFYLSRKVIHQPVACLIIIFMWLVAALGLVWWVGEFRCPRCRRRYAALGQNSDTNVTRGLFDKVCSNCKLRKFERAR